MGEQLRIALWSYLNTGAKVGRWRTRARAVIKREVEAYLNEGCDIIADDVLKGVDAEYPFGQRSHHPYKAWLTERAILKAVLGLDEQPPEPNAEDFAAVEVAIDLVESERFEEALALLAEQAPRRLNRDCPVCGAKKYRDCLSPGSGGPRIVPHIGRVMSTRANGPLFGEQL
jgi:hypothetical protein